MSSDYTRTTEISSAHRAASPIRLPPITSINVSPVPVTVTFIPGANPISANRFRHPDSGMLTRTTRPVSPAFKSESRNDLRVEGAWPGTTGFVGKCTVRFDVSTMVDVAVGGVTAALFKEPPNHNILRLCFK